MVCRVIFRKHERDREVALGADHPIAWSHTVGLGHAFYTGLGHRRETYADPRFREHIRQATLWDASRLLFLDDFERADLTGWSSATD